MNAQVKVYNCPLFRRCYCPAKLRVTRSHPTSNNGAHEGFSDVQNRKGIAVECSKRNGDEHKGTIKWTGNIGVEHGLCFVKKSGEILSKY